MSQDNARLTGEQGVTLRQGEQVLIRPIRPDDAARLQGLFSRLSPESIYLRFLGARREMSIEQARALANVDYHHTMALVATFKEDGDELIIGVARYASIAGSAEDRAEAAVVVEDRFQNQGLGTLLLRALVSYAREHGIGSLVATVHQTNDRMMRFIERSHMPHEHQLDSGMWEIRVDLTTDT